MVPIDSHLLYETQEHHTNEMDIKGRARHGSAFLFEK